MAIQQTPWGSKYYHFTKELLNLNDLKVTGIQNNYLYSTKIPFYPKPKFQVSKLKHDTDREGLEGIFGDSGFSEGREPLVWFSLTVSPEEIRSAEKRLLEEEFPQLPKENAPNNFLWRFATSPAFSETSRYGSFRFTLNLEDVLNAYSQQFCFGERPVMRVYGTSLFKQEVQYIVLVHRPAYNERFSNFPLLEELPEDSVCKYKDGRFIWRSQAMCETHRYVIRGCVNEIEVVHDAWDRFYVWDNVSIAMHVESKEVLRLTKDQLGKGLTYCAMTEATFMAYRTEHFMDYDEAQPLVERLWPSVQLGKELPLQSHFEAPVDKQEDLE